MAGNSTEAGRSVTNKITSILMTFTEGSEHSLTEISQLAGLPISTAHRLTSELASWRLLERTADGRYKAGLALRMMGTGDSCPPALRERAPCVLEDLSRVTRCRVRLGVLQDLEVAYIEKQPGPRPVSSFMPAATLPVHPTALGRALLAFASASVVEMTILRGLRAYTPHTVTAPDRFRRALAVVRLTRVAVTRFELEATSCAVAVPVFGPGAAAGDGCVDHRCAESVPGARRRIGDERSTGQRRLRHGRRPGARRRPKRGLSSRRHRVRCGRRFPVRRPAPGSARCPCAAGPASDRSARPTSSPSPPTTIRCVARRPHARQPRSAAARRRRVRPGTRPSGPEG
jgi:DNA-binding IclR family transcriptional regulator